MFPGYLMNVVEECCDGDWTLAYRLIREQEEFEWRRDLHLDSLRGTKSSSASHLRLMQLRQRRVGKELEAAARKAVRKRRRGKGYKRYHRNLVIARGIKKIEEERKKEAEFEKRRLAIEAGEIDEADDEDDVVKTEVKVGQSIAQSDPDALLKLAIGDSDPNPNEAHSTSNVRLLDWMKLNVVLRRTQMQHWRAQKKLEEAVYCLPHLKAQFAAIEEARLLEAGEDPAAAREAIKKKKKKASLPTQIVEHSKLIKNIKLEVCISIFKHKDDPNR
jgi:hypothetical protein